jgi:thiamine-monophosphate kinase
LIRDPDELEIIKTIAKNLPRSSQSRIGDDVAHLQTSRGLLIAKCDMLVRTTDAPKQMNLWQIARKAIAMTVSDFAAKGVQPTYAMISLGIPRGFSRDSITELARGFRAASDEFSVQIVGGDTNEACDLIIDSIMLGFADDVVRRDGAKHGEVVVTFDGFGYPPLGLKALAGEITLPRRIRVRAVESVLMPKVKLKLALALASRSLMSASADSSDGLAFTLNEIARSSRVGMVLDELPIAKKLKGIFLPIPLKEAVLFGGEEYEIVATIREADIDATRRLVATYKGELHVLGRVDKTRRGVWLRTRRGLERIPPRGWTHLK